MPLDVRHLAAGLLIAPFLSAATLPADAQSADPAGLVEALRGGGHVIYIRHARTEVDYADQVMAVMGYCTTQRVLGEEGWQEARAIGGAFERLAIPVGEVLSSEYCRAWQTADLAFGRYEKTPALNFQPAETYSDAQVAAMRDAVTPLLSEPPAEPGENTVIVAHDDPFEAATGIYPEPMGVAYVLRPGGDGTFEVLGAIAPDQWPEN